MRTQGLFFRDQARALSKEHEVDVLYCHRGKRFYSNLYTDDGIKTFYWGYRLRIGSILGMISRIFIYCMMFILYQKKRKVDIIHCHSVAFNQDGSAGIAGVILGKLFSIPVVITEHATVFSNKKYGRFEKRLMRWALSNADMIICVSEGLRDILEEMTLRQDILIIPNTIDFKTFVNNDIAVHKIKKEND
ncbi:glycosyltransferase, partial [Escherichia coli]|nr:glycosyltransferase [Escherichia coli]